jgi:hypothetical protein
MAGLSESVLAKAKASHIAQTVDLFLGQCALFEKKSLTRKPGCKSSVLLLLFRRSDRIRVSLLILYFLSCSIRSLKETLGSRADFRFRFGLVEECWLLPVEAVVLSFKEEASDCATEPCTGIDALVSLASVALVLATDDLSVDCFAGMGASASTRFDGVADLDQACRGVLFRCSASKPGQPNPRKS